jgi:hypothetical protein
VNPHIRRTMKRLVGLAALVIALVVPGTAMARDRDHDHMRDSWERKHHLSTHRANGHRDADRDGLSNLGEFRAHTDPQDADTDDDCIADDDEDADDDGLDNGDEMRDHTGVQNPDSDDDGIEDGAEDRDDDGVANAEDADDNDDGEADDDDDQGEQCEPGGDEGGEHESGVDD